MARGLTREQLYDAVWLEPVSRAAEQFGVSGVALAKACRKADIPTPPVGYWAKRAAGKKVQRAPLPPRDFGMPDWITIGAADGEFSAGAEDCPLDAPPPDPPQFVEPFELLMERASAATSVVRTRPGLDRADPAIAKLLADDEQRRIRYSSSSYPSPFDKPRYDEPIERRRLRILDALFRAMRARGYTPYLSERHDSYQRDPERVAGVRIHGSTVEFTLEPVGASLRKGGKPSSRLRLTLKGSDWLWSFPTSWEDGEDRRLESSLRDVAAGVLVAAEGRYRAHQLWCHRWQLEKREEALAEQERRRREEAESAERARLAAKRQREAALLKMARDSQRAEMIRAWVDRVRKQWTASGEPPQELQAWSEWALEVADGLDPLTDFSEVLARRASQDEVRS